MITAPDDETPSPVIDIPTLIDTRPVGLFQLGIFLLAGHRPRRISTIVAAGFRCGGCRDSGVGRARAPAPALVALASGTMMGAFAKPLGETTRANNI